ncbi:MAG: GTP-binding protein [Planctomycetes bacterium]|nr:GTP-binding protein [Planctomycetota bacterium]
MDRLRTFGIVAHIDAGKTTLTERILYDAGAQSWLGSVDEGTATMDWMPAERRRGISIAAAATRVDWGEHVLQVVDTPGHVDFVAEVERCLHVLDGVVVLVDGVRGVESQTEAVWHQANARGLPRLVFVNKLDRAGADFDAVVAELEERLECRALPIVVPLHDAAGRFAGLADACSGAVQWFEGRPEPELAVRLQQRLSAATERVVDAAAFADEHVLADAVAGRPIPGDRLRAALRGPFLDGRLVPVLCGAALWNRGVDWLLDAVVHFLPSLRELPRRGLWSVADAGDPAAPFCGMVFKVQHQVEVWNFVRVVRGRLERGGAWCAAARPGSVRTCAELWLVQADRHVDALAAVPGEIVVLPGELGLRTGDTVCDPRHPVALPVPRFPTPVLAVTFEPERAEDAPRILAALRELEVDDPTLRVDHVPAGIVVRGMGELHLDIVADLVRERTGTSFQLSPPQVDRRETVQGAGVGEAEVRALVAGRERVARCQVAVTPQGPPDRPAEVVDAAGAVAAADELRARAETGSRVGPLFGVRIELQAAEASPEAGEALLQQAAAKALAAALSAGEIAELEPWVGIEVWCPEAAANAVLADLAARGVSVTGVASGRLGARLTGAAAMARMLGYVTRLRSMTRGKGQLSMQPLGFRAARNGRVGG